MENIGKKIYEISEMLNEKTVKEASNEELMAYLFLVEKMKKTLEKACKINEEE